MISSMLAPASRFSNTAETGIRVSRKTHAPLNLSATLSTAGHWDQSRVAMFSPSSHRSLLPRFGGGVMTQGGQLPRYRRKTATDPEHGQLSARVRGIPASTQNG